MKTRWFVIVRYTDIWGEDHEKEIPCTDKRQAVKREADMKNAYKHDPTVSSYNVLSVRRKS